MSKASIRGDHPLLMVDGGGQTLRFLEVGKGRPHISKGGQKLGGDNFDKGLAGKRVRLLRQSLGLCRVLQALITRSQCAVVGFYHFRSRMDGSCSKTGKQVLLVAQALEQRHCISQMLHRLGGISGK